MFQTDAGKWNYKKKTNLLIERSFHNYNFLEIFEHNEGKNEMIWIISTIIDLKISP